MRKTQNGGRDLTAVKQQHARNSRILHVCPPKEPGIILGVNCSANEVRASGPPGCVRHSRSALPAGPDEAAFRVINSALENQNANLISAKARWKGEKAVLLYEFLLTHRTRRPSGGRK